MMIEKDRVGWVVLHYEALGETCACVETLSRVSAENDIIIIVDNHSPNGSGKELMTRFHDKTNITVVLNQENLGFAGGNNVGYVLAKHKYRCDFIVLLNNDTLIQQKNFRANILTAYETYRFAVMGPKILCADGSVNPCSPMLPIHTSLQRARIGQISNHIRLLLSICNLDIMLAKIVDKPSQGQKLSPDSYREDVQISGCCIIFSKEYIERFEGLHPETFMYLEESILYIRVKNAGLKMIYNPALEIVHLEDAATLASFKGKKRKTRQFKYKCQIHSFKVLIQEIRKENKMERLSTWGLH